MVKKIFNSKNRKVFYYFLTVTPLTFASFIVLLSVFFSAGSAASIVAVNGVADLSKANFKQNKSISVTGEYEFFVDKFIITQRLTNATPDFVINVPSLWSTYEINNQNLPSSGKASYRVVLKNCPPNQPITAYLPDIDCTYRVFLNNQLVYSLTESRSEQVYTNILNEPLPSESVLTVEILSRYSNGLFVSPILRCSEGYASSKSLISFVSAALFGMNVLALAFYLFIICTSKSAASLIWRASLTILAMIVVFSKDSFFNFWRVLLPSESYFYFSVITHCAIAFVPYMSINFLSALAMVNFNPSIKKVYQALGIIGTFICFALYSAGQMSLLGIVLFICLLPLIHVVINLNKLIIKNIKYSCNLTSATLYLFFALALETLSFSGLMQFKIVLLSPVFLTVSTILVATYFARISVGKQSEAKEAAQLRLSLREREYSLMLSQIKPHFLYNALVAIEMLCTESPESAAIATRQFSEYLRSNMRSITAKDPIPFLDEMHHVQSYAAIEMLRFKNRLNYSCNLEVTDFHVPPLTIQPLVENAIKHGACKNIKGGNVFVHSYEDSDNYYVEIIDDGVGFNKNCRQENEPHGLANIEMRLKHLMNAGLEISSEIGNGTRAVVIIPKLKEV